MSLLLPLWRQRRTTRNTAVVVEPRLHRHLSQVVVNVAVALGPRWQVLVFHGYSARAWLLGQSAALRQLVRSGAVQLRPLASDGLSIDAYNALFTAPSFWEQLSGEKVLVFQADTALCAEDPGGADALLRADVRVRRGARRVESQSAQCPHHLFI